MKLNLIFAVVIVALAAYMVFGHNGLLKYRELVRIKNNYELQLHTTEKKMQDMQKELEQVRKNSEYLEMMIKKELSMKKPEEDLYIIEKPLVETPSETTNENK